MYYWDLIKYFIIILILILICVYKNVGVWLGFIVQMEYIYVLFEI